MIASPPAEPTRVSSGVLTAVLCLSGTVVALQQTLVTPLVTHLPELLDIDYADATWLVTVTLLVSAVAMPIVSRLADMYGKKRMMLIAMSTMIVGSVVAAVGGSFVPVLIGRALQGLAPSMIPVAIAVLRDELPREKVAGATALMSATLGIGSALGLPLSGLVYQYLGWESIFWLSATAGLALLVALWRVVPESPIRTPGRFDYLGAVLLSAALSSMLLAVSKGGTWGWTSQFTLIAAATSVVSFAVWFPLQLRLRAPMVDLRVSARRPVLLTNVVGLLVGFAMYANMFATTQQLVITDETGYGHGLSVLVAGLCMMPASLMMIAFAPVSARMIARVGARLTLIVGGSVLAVAYVVRIFLTGSVPLIVLGAMLVTIGTAIAYATMPLLIMGSVPITQTASANGLNTLLRAVGTSVSGAVIAALLTTVTIDVAGRDLPSLAAFQIIFGMSAAAAFVAVGVAVFIPRRTAPVSDPVPVRADEGESVSVG
ncbi:MFS transporter [Rhodococcus sp. Q]|uniref:MFS transporter n=1 Tax=Rhodococcus sp. Q TaxID=2502252 RepID=UPI0020162C3F|nr:MFS transporter [Rhodococcus sp. Q]